MCIINKVISLLAWNSEGGNKSKWCWVPCEGGTLAVNFGNSSWSLQRYEENPYENIGWLHMHCLQTTYTVFRLCKLSTESVDCLQNICTVYRLYTGTAVAQWLRCCATYLKVAGSIPDGVIAIFHWHNPPDRTMVLGSTQPLTEMSTRRISWG